MSHTATSQAPNGHTSDGEGIGNLNRTKMPSGPADETTSGPPPIAIVGIGLRLPGGISTTDAFWDLLISKKDTRSRVPETRYNIDAFHSPSAVPGTIRSQHGYFLSHDISHMDAPFFSMSRAEVEKLDPQQRLLLEVVWECMESGGQRGWRGQKIGCYVGVFGEDWLDLNAKDPLNLGLYRITGSGDFALANRVSYEYDLKGPSMTIRTACSSALVGLHEACQAIYTGECDSAVVAGTNLILSPTMTIAMTEQGALSPTGSCKSFDAKADGYARGEAVNAVYIKKLSDAVRDGDPIRAVIRATATNCDGKTPGIAYPSSESHEALIRRAYNVAGISDVSGTALVECHGTGTAVGDPLEATAIGRVFGKKGIMISSVKPNVGHSEGASGITSLIKAILALEHRTIPPSINFSEPNPKIPWNEFSLSVTTNTIAWPGDRLERVSVNSFGIGGTNVHVVVDSAKSFVDKGREKGRTGHHLLLFSANHTDSLRESVVKYQSYAEKHPQSLADLSNTLGTRRDHFPYRAFAVADGTWPLQVSQFMKAKVTPAVNFVFTGQGAQWAGMGVDLLRESSAFRDDITAMDKALAKLPHAPLWTIEEELLRPEKQTRLHRAEFAQPICTAVQIGLVNLLKSCKVHPSAVVGHSSGEIAAAYAAGALTLDAAMAVAYYRGQVAKQQLRAGGMAAVGLGRQAAIQYLEKGVVVACENSPSSVTLSGDEEVLDAVLSRVRADKPDCLVRRLKVEVAYHSHHMQEVGGLYEGLLKHSEIDGRPAVPFFSSVTAKSIAKGDRLGPAYWRANLESPVLFYQAVRTMLKDAGSSTLCLEIGPHPVLAGPLRDIFKAAAAENARPVYVPTLVRAENGAQALLSNLGRLYQEGVAVDTASLTPDAAVLTDLPAYSWQHGESYWSESRVAREFRQRKCAAHELLGNRLLEADDVEPAWRNMVGLDNVRWVRDHCVHDDVVLPGAAYVCMASEAVRQTVGGEVTGVSLRQVEIKAALVLSETARIEVVTRLRPVRLTSTLNSAWFDFSIVSFNGTAWVKHCVGQVRAGCDDGLLRKVDVDEGARRVAAAAWYKAMAGVGLNYGPSFQGLMDLSAHPGRHQAAARIVDCRDSSPDASYLLHPATIDLCLQLFTVALAEGSSRHLSRLCVPTYLGALYVSTTTSDMGVGAVASAGPTGAITGAATAVDADGRVALCLENARFSPLGDNEETRVNTAAAARLHWKPSLDHADPNTLIRSRSLQRDATCKLERLSLLCILGTLHRIAAIQPSAAHLSCFRDWLLSQKQRARDGRYDRVDDCARLADLGPGELQAEIDKAAEKVQQTASIRVGEVMTRALSCAGAIFAGELEPIEVLMQENGLENIYVFVQNMCDCTPYFELFSHLNPTARILEIGAGTGGTTAEVLRGLTDSGAGHMYARYEYTDISPGFFTAAQQRFKEYSHIEYRVLDISRDPIEQGFEVGSYDLILASNVLHATPYIGETLRNVRKLLKPNGRLFLQELNLVGKCINFIMGFLPGWWLGAADGRSEEPLMPISRWDTELRSAGFSGIDAVVHDDEYPYQINANIISTAAKSPSPLRQVTLLCGSPGILARSVYDVLTQRNFEVSFGSLDDPLPSEADAISLLDLERPFFYDISADELSKFQAYLRRLQPTSGILWATGHAQVGCRDPRYAETLGVCRTIRSELSIDLATVEVDIEGSLDIKKLVDVFQGFSCRVKGAELDPDCEYAIWKDQVYVPRYRWIDLGQELCEAGQGKLRKLNIGQIGQLPTLQWVEGKEVLLQDFDVEIEPRAVGMNFKDVLVAMGIVEGTKPGLGLECAGVVRKVGDKVQGFVVGDRVVAFEHGCFSTRLVVPATLLAKIPDTLSFKEAATMPCVYATAIHALINVGGLSKGQTVLIHSACGGVGIAAIQLCQMMEAEVFATVGNSEKTQYLVENFGLPRIHIFNSRDSSFYADLMAATDGKGADLVLNSLSGELLHVSWRCVAEFGKMLEIGKRDFIGRAMLSMDAFEANRTFHGIDMAQMAVQRPESCRRLLEQCMEYYRSGAIRPIAPIKMFSASHVVEAFRYMQKGQHIGKLVVAIPDNPAELDLTLTTPDSSFRDDAAYILLGGLGGLGKAISNWMVEKGARHLVYLSRSGGESDDDRAFLHELESQGCSVQTFKGSVVSAEDVTSMVRNVAKPIAGVMHLSMVLKDRNLLQFSHEDWMAAINPKVDGAWNMHNALGDTPLDFFILFSSLSCVVGHVGQANYAAANTFLAAFTQYRHSLGLPAGVLDIGVMEDVGYVCENPGVLEHFKAMSSHTLKEQNLIDALTYLIRHQTPGTEEVYTYVNPAELVLGLASTKPLADPTNRTVWRRDARMALAHLTAHGIDAVSSSNQDNDDLKTFLLRVAAEPALLDEPESAALLTRVIGERLRGFVFHNTEEGEGELDSGTSLLALGVDSLVAIEVRGWWRRALGVEVSVVQILSAGNVAKLGAVAVEGLKEKFTKKEDGVRAKEGEGDTYLLNKAP